MTQSVHIRSLPERWLWLGVMAVAVAGLYALVPVIGRTPQLKNLGIMQELFDVALVIHVDLSVTVWFFAMIGLGAAQLMQAHAWRWPYWGKAGFACVALATAFMAFSPLWGGTAIKSNYIPVLHNGQFLFALGLLFAGLVVTFLPLMLTYANPRAWKALSPDHAMILAAAAVVLLGLGAYVLAAYALPAGLEHYERYERLFWAGGHIMQFAFTLLVMAAWIQLLRAVGGAEPSRRFSGIVIALTVLGALLSFVGFVLHDFMDVAFTAYQTRIMIEWGGIGVTVLGAWIVWKMLHSSLERRSALFRALVVSLVLFFFGGVLGLMISGQNVTIPAHYHGMITGITQALMGVAYLSLSRFGYPDVTHSRFARAQPLVYGLGQMMHIGGLAYCGGYGVLRKTAGGFEHLAPDIKIALGIFGLGGLLAITGGVLFVIVMARAAYRTSASPQPPVL